jgi:ABC-type Fe3+ transport system substrate-binding protein
MNVPMKRLFALVLYGALFTVYPHPVLSAQSNLLDPYIEAAKKEGSVTLGLTIREKSHGKPAGELYLAAFQKAYPFLKVHFKRLGGSRERERVIVEMAAGMTEYDVATISETQVSTLVDAKLAHMIEWQKFGIPKIIINPKNIGVSLRIPVYGIAYNRDLIPDAVAKTFTWETCTDPKWKAKITMDNRPRFLELFYRDDVWGREKTLDYAKRWAANKPVLNSSQSDATQKVNAGVHYMMCGIARGQVKDVQVYTGSKSLGIVYPEPVPIGAGDLIYVPDKAKHLNAGILFLAWSATPEAQRILDETDFTGDPRIEGSSIQAELKGKKVVYPTWEDTSRADDYLADILTAMGFPVVR